MTVCVCVQALCVPINDPELLALVGTEYAGKTVLTKTDIQNKRFASWGPKDKVFVRNLQVLTWCVQACVLFVFRLCSDCVQNG